ncbi:hypothetical protein D3C79_697170 [compost metagenome]
MVHQALGRDIQALLQPLIAPQIQLLIKQRRFQLAIQLLQQPPALGEETRTIQMAMVHELTLVQLLDAGQGIAYLFQALIQHVLAHAHGQTGVAEQAGDFGLVLHHEIRFDVVECLQRTPRMLRSRHKLSLFARAGISIVRITDNEDFPSFEPLRIRGVEPL